jgi:aryl-alcohol dehydrogenase-like predicted oxidoreductase
MSGIDQIDRYAEICIVKGSCPFDRAYWKERPGGAMEIRRLAPGLEVGALGLGCMGMTHGYVRPEDMDEAESIATLHRALDRGVTLLDTAEVYGPFTNEILVGKAIRGRRNQVAVATKFGLHTPDGTPENARRTAEASLKRLGVDVIDLYYLHRKDPAIPIEETVGGMKRLVEDGLVRFLGLSEVGPETLRRAHAVHPIAALQSEYSVFERGVEERILPTLRELGIGFVPFSPLGRGFLAGAFKDDRELPQGDFRHHVPRFAPENAEANAAILGAIREVAARHGATPAQVALAWVLSRGADMVPIPGTRKRSRLDENLDALDLALAPADLAALEPLASQVAGDRYTPDMMRRVER